MIILFICLCAVLVYMLQDYIYGRYWDEGLSAEVSFQSEPVFEGEEALLTEVVTNRKYLPLPAVHVKFQTDRKLQYKQQENASVSDKCYKHDIFSMMPYQKITRTMPVHCAGRGYFEIHQADLTSSNIFMANHYVTQQNLFTCLYVFPRQLSVKDIDIPFRSLMGSVITKRMTNEDPFEFKGIRDYQPYDSIKNINWKASARTNQLLVNVFDHTAGQEIRIIVNLEDETIHREYQLLEASMRLASSLAARFIMNSVPVSIMTTGIDILSGDNQMVAAGSGQLHMRSINEMLARIDLEQKMIPVLDLLNQEMETDSHSSESEITYLFISYTQREDVYQAFSNLSRGHAGSLWLLPLKPYMNLRISGNSEFDVMKWEVRQDDTK